MCLLSVAQICEVHFGDSLIDWHTSWKRSDDSLNGASYWRHFGIIKDDFLDESLSGVSQGHYRSDVGFCGHLGAKCCDKKLFDKGRQYPPGCSFVSTTDVITSLKVAKSLMIRILLLVWKKCSSVCDLTLRRSLISNSTQGRQNAYKNCPSRTSNYRQHGYDVFSPFAMHQGLFLPLRVDVAEIFVAGVPWMVRYGCVMSRKHRRGVSIRDCGRIQSLWLCLETFCAWLAETVAIFAMSTAIVIILCGGQWGR